MQLGMDPLYAEGYRSASQIARRVTEGWAKDNLYCAACDSSVLVPEKPNSQAIDFRCSRCLGTYQLKAGRLWSERRVPDAGYDAMMRALESDSVPNLLVMQYSTDWRVENLLLVPSFFFTPAAIQKRKPLGPNARRAGWVGCNILLSSIAEDGKIRMVSHGTSTAPETVRAEYERIRPFSSLGVRLRGWTLDVLRVIQSLKSRQFTLADVYAHEGTLAKTYPQNKHVRPKIRQQLQVLRDLGYVRFKERGSYELRDGGPS